jgi:hypothetical protein
MKCPECVRLGLTSRFNEHRAEPIKGEVERFFDEDGTTKHAHDHTEYRIVMACTNGHAFKQQFQSRCPVKACAWNERPEVKAGAKKIGE